MKTMMKKLVASITAVAIAVLMCVPMMAWGTPGGTDGKITINGAAEGMTYNIYRICDLESYNHPNYSYKATTNWETYLKSASIT